MAVFDLTTFRARHHITVNQLLKGLKDNAHLLYPGYTCIRTRSAYLKWQSESYIPSNILALLNIIPNSYWESIKKSP